MSERNMQDAIEIKALRRRTKEGGEAAVQARATLARMGVNPAAPDTPGPFMHGNDMVFPSMTKAEALAALAAIAKRPARR